MRKFGGAGDPDGEPVAFFERIGPTERHKGGREPPFPPRSESGDPIINPFSVAALGAWIVTNLAAGAGERGHAGQLI